MAIVQLADCGGGDDNDFISAVGTYSIQNSVTPHGVGYALRVNPTLTGTGYVSLCSTLTTTGRQSASQSIGAAGGFRFQFRVDTLPSAASEEIVSVFDTAAALKVVIRVTSAGNLAIYDKTGTGLVATGATVLSLGVFYEIKFQWGTAVGNSPYVLQIDQVVELTGSADQGAVNAGTVRFGKYTNRNGKSVDFYYAYMSIDDAFLPASGRIVSLVAGGNGFYTNGTPTGAATNWQCTVEIPPDITTYVTTSAIADEAYTAVMSGSLAGTINATQGFALVRNGGSTSKPKILARSASTDSAVTTGPNATSTYAGSFLPMAVDPATGTTWLAAAVNVTEVGIANGSAVASRITQLRLLVDYVPSSTPAAPSRKPVVLGSCKFKNLTCYNDTSF